MKPRILIASALLALTIITLRWNQGESKPGHHDSTPASSPLKPPGQEAQAPSDPTEPPESPPTTPATPARPETEKNTILDKIYDAAAMYDPAYLPVIEPYLTHTDPEIRAGAVNAMIILGDAAASPMLREAAVQMTSSDDAKMMFEAADYLELPEADITKFLDPDRTKRVDSSPNQPPPDP